MCIWNRCLFASSWRLPCWPRALGNRPRFVIGTPVAIALIITRRDSPFAIFIGTPRSAMTNTTMQEGAFCTLILPQESSDEELPRRDHVPALVPLNMDVVAATFASDPDCRPAPVASTDSPLEPAPVGAFSLSHPRVARSAPLLCDTARHERSGVQLA
jgi:hypothetical protein